MTKTWYEKQKDLFHTAIGAYTWIKEKLKKGDIDDDLVEDDFVVTLKRLKWSLGREGIQRFVHGHSIFPSNGFQVIDPWSMHAPFYWLSGPDQIWAWEVFCMSCIHFPDDLPTIILLAKKQATQKGVVISDIMEAPKEDIKFMQDIRRHRGIDQGEHSISRIIDALQNANLLCEVGDRFYATVVDGIGRGSYSLFDAASMAEVALDDFHYTENIGDNDELSILIRDLGICLSSLQLPLRKNYILNGKELLDSARENYLKKFTFCGPREREFVKQKEAEYKNCLLYGEDNLSSLLPD